MSLNNKEVADAVANLVRAEISSEHNENCICNICLSKKSNDVINWPKHYNATSVQPIDAIEAWNLGFHLGNVVKYIARAGKKDPNKELEDLKKARWYLDRKIEKLENK
jgi:hypothetical protein